MRILFLAYSHVSFAAGGAQLIADEMLRAAAARGHEVAMVAAPEARDALPFRHAKTPLVSLPGDERVKIFAPEIFDDEFISCGDWRAMAALREHIRAFAPDVIHFHHYHRVGVEALVAAQLAAPQAKITLTFHEMAAICPANGQMVKVPSGDICLEAAPEACAQCAPARSPAHYALRAERIRVALAYCDHFVFPSEPLAETYVEWGLPVEKCVVIFNGLAPFAEARPPPSANFNRFAYFGQLIDNKGLDVVLAALLHLAETGRIPAEGLEFRVNGANQHYATPGYISRVAALRTAVEAASGGRIRIVDRGEYARDELAARMGETDWVVVPSVWPEAFGLVVSEAWTFGRPVIASDIGALSERVRPGVDGLTFPPRDHLALADLFATAAGDAETWRRMSESITIQPTADEMVAAYEQLWREPRPARP